MGPASRGRRACLDVPRRLFLSADNRGCSESEFCDEQRPFHSINTPLRILSITNNHRKPSSSASPLMISHEPGRRSASSFSGQTWQGLSTPNSTTMSSYYPPHDLGSVSPSEGPSHLMDNLRPGAGGPGVPSPIQLSNMIMHNPKRAYRQRRKDPSCDACRERKVKVCSSRESPLVVVC